jgi:hypothetical protein
VALNIYIYIFFLNAKRKKHKIHSKKYNLNQNFNSSKAAYYAWDVERKHTGHNTVHWEETHWTQYSTLRGNTLGTIQYLEKKHTRHNTVHWEETHWVQYSTLRGNTLGTIQYLERKHTGHNTIPWEETHWAQYSTLRGNTLGKIQYLESKHTGHNTVPWEETHCTVRKDFLHYPFKRVMYRRRSNPPWPVIIPSFLFLFKITRLNR